MKDGIIDAMWNNDGYLEPLYEEEDRGDEMVITFALPYVDKKDIEVCATKETLEVMASMKKSVCWERWGITQRKIMFKSFKKQICLPENVNSDGATAEFKNGILKITLPKIKKKSSIKISGA